MRKFLFLDIDGVLNHEKWFIYKHRMIKEKREEYDKLTYWFDPECVRRVKELIEETNSELVISSSWRHDRSLPENFVKIGMPSKFYMTPCHASRHRGIEIEMFLSKVSEPYNYCILDDSNDMLRKQRKHFVHVADELYEKQLVEMNGGTGFTEICKQRAINILKNDKLCITRK